MNKWQHQDLYIDIKYTIREPLLHKLYGMATTYNPCKCIWFTMINCNKKDRKHNSFTGIINELHSGAPNGNSWQISAPQPACSWLARKTELV